MVTQTEAGSAPGALERMGSQSTKLRCGLPLPGPALVSQACPASPLLLHQPPSPQPWEPREYRRDRHTLPFQTECFLQELKGGEPAWGETASPELPVPGPWVDRVHLWVSRSQPRAWRAGPSTKMQPFLWAL